MPVLLVIAALAGVAAAASPTVRDQLGLSFTRQPVRYVELFLLDERAARACAADASGRLTIAVGVRSHLASPRALAWTATVERPSARASSGTSPSTAPSRVVRETGSVDTEPGRTARFEVRFPPGPRPTAIVVSLRGRSETVQVRCE